MAASATSTNSLQDACLAYLYDNKNNYYINGVSLAWLLERDMALSSSHESSRSSLAEDNHQVVVKAGHPETENTYSIASEDACPITLNFLKKYLFKYFIAQNAESDLAVTASNDELLNLFINSYRFEYERNMTFSPAIECFFEKKLVRKVFFEHARNGTEKSSLFFEHLYYLEPKATGFYASNIVLRNWVKQYGEQPFAIFKITFRMFFGYKIEPKKFYAEINYKDISSCDLSNALAAKKLELEKKYLLAISTVELHSDKTIEHFASHGINSHLKNVAINFLEFNKQYSGDQRYPWIEKINWVISRAIHLLTGEQKSYSNHREIINPLKNIKKEYLAHRRMLRVCSSLKYRSEIVNFLESNITIRLEDPFYYMEQSYALCFDARAVGGGYSENDSGRTRHNSLRNSVSAEDEVGANLFSSIGDAKMKLALHQLYIQNMHQGGVQHLPMAYITFLKQELILHENNLRLFSQHIIEPSDRAIRFDICEESDGFYIQTCCEYMSTNSEISAPVFTLEIGTKISLIENSNTEQNYLARCLYINCVFNPCGQSVIDDFFEEAKTRIVEIIVALPINSDLCLKKFFSKQAHDEHNKVDDLVLEKIKQAANLILNAETIYQYNHWVSYASHIVKKAIYLFQKIPDQFDLYQDLFAPLNTIKASYEAVTHETTKASSSLYALLGAIKSSVYSNPGRQDQDIVRQLMQNILDLQTITSSSDKVTSSCKQQPRP